MAYLFRVLLRVVITFGMLLLMTRLTGKKQISQSTFFDFITAIAVGDIAGEKLSDPNAPLLPWLAATLLWFGLIIGVDLLILSNRKLAKILEGEPTVLIENGRILEKRLKSNYLRVDELMAHLRKKNCFNPGDAEFAIFETDGTISVLPRSQMRPVTPRDLNVPTNYEGIARELIVEGEILTKNLREVGLTEEWLMAELEKQGYFGPGGIFYATLDTEGKLSVDAYQDRLDSTRVQIHDYGPN